MRIADPKALSAKFKPGERVCVSCFTIDPDNLRNMFEIRPSLWECCCGRPAEKDAELRLRFGADAKPRRLAPVDPETGALDYDRTIKPFAVNACRTMREAEAAYQADLRAAAGKLDGKIREIEGIKAGIAKKIRPGREFAI